MAIASEQVKGCNVICLRVGSFITKVETSRAKVYELCSVPLRDEW